MNRYQLCCGSNSQSLDLSLPQEHSLKKDENTFSGFKSALNRCPYAEPSPSLQQHLYAVVMKTPQRPRGAGYSEVGGEEKTGGSFGKEGQCCGKTKKSNVWEIKNSSAELFQRDKLPRFRKTCSKNSFKEAGMPVWFIVGPLNISLRLSVCVCLCD